MKRKGQKVFAALCACMVLVSGCAGESENTYGTNRQPVTPKAESETGEIETDIITYDAEETKSLDRVPLGEPIYEFGLPEGELYYTIEKSEAFDNLADASLQADDLVLNECNNYTDMEMFRKYPSLGECIEESGEVVSSHRLVTVDVTIANKDAVGREKKTMFSIGDFYLTNVENGDFYFMAYFSESDNSPKEGQPFYYSLEPGAEMKVKIGFLVPTDGVEKGEIMGWFNEKLFEIGL